MQIQEFINNCKNLQEEAGKIQEQLTTFSPTNDISMRISEWMYMASLKLAEITPIIETMKYEIVEVINELEKEKR